MGIMKRALEAGIRIPAYGKQPPAKIADYERGWSSEMTNIWHEKMDMMKTIDTGALYSSISGMCHEGPNTTIEHKFLLYGLYVAAGVGHGFKQGNSGDLPFLGADYREKHGLDKPKAVGPAWSKASRRFPHTDNGRVIAGGHPLKPRDWFTRKYIYSIKRLNEAEALFYSYAYKGLVSSGLDNIFRGTGDVGQYHNVGASL